MQFNWPIIGHAAAVQLLQTALTQNTLHHAYLLCGPQGVGKTTLTTFFVRSLLCLKSSASEGVVPCASCSACRMLEKNIHPDVIWMSRGEERVIPISSVRLLLDRLATTSFLRSYKVAIIEDADCLTLEAANALLKILEEPPRNTLFILMARTLMLLPSTIISRVSLLPLRLQSTTFIERTLEVQGMRPEEARNIASASYGRPGRTRDLQNKGVVKQWSESIARAKNFVCASAGVRMTMIPDMLQDYGEELLHTLLCVAGREILLQRVRGEDHGSLGEIIAFLKGLQEVPVFIARNISPRVAFEYAVIA